MFQRVEECIFCGPEIQWFTAILSNCRLVLLVRPALVLITEYKFVKSVTLLCSNTPLSHECCWLNAVIWQQLKGCGFLNIAWTWWIFLHGLNSWIELSKLYDEHKSSQIMSHLKPSIAACINHVLMILGGNQIFMPRDHTTLSTKIWKFSKIIFNFSFCDGAWKVHAVWPR